MRSVEGGESAASHGVPAEDQWMGEIGSTAADPEVMVERGGPGAAPHEMMEGSGSGAAPHEVREMSPPALEQGAGLKRSRLHELEQGSGGSSPKRTHRPKATSMSPIPLVFPFLFFFVPILCLFLFCRFLRWGHPLGPVPKKSLSL